MKTKRDKAARREEKKAARAAKKAAKKACTKVSQDMRNAPLPKLWFRAAATEKKDTVRITVQWDKGATSMGMPLDNTELWRELKKVLKPEVLKLGL